MKIGLNLGCGTRIFESTGDIRWVNIDAVPGPGVEAVFDWKKLRSNFSDGLIDIIVAHQTFEHEGCGEQPITDCFLLLKEGGSLIVSVPDLRKLALMWLNGELSTQIYLTNIYGPYDGTEQSRHRWGFDPEYLENQLHREAPWKEIKMFDWRELPGANLARDDRWILCMEAVK